MEMILNSPRTRCDHQRFARHGHKNYKASVFSMSGVKTTRNGAILEVTIDRPPANAIDLKTSRELSDAFSYFHSSADLQVAIVTSGGTRFFSAGWDLKSAASGAYQVDWGAGGFAGLTELFELNKPVIAAVDGMAVGGGFELALACDLIVASESSEFFLPESRVGLIADGGGVLRLPKRLPYSIAMEMFLIGRRMGAREAFDRGLVNHVTPDGTALSRAWTLAEQILASAPLAVQAYKEVVKATAHLPVSVGYEVMRSDVCPTYRRMRESEDFREGPRAFAEKRAPQWKGH